MLTTLLASAIINSQTAPVITYVSTENDRFPIFFPGKKIEDAKNGPVTFIYREHTWETHYVNGEYVAIDLDATEIAPLRAFYKSLSDLSKQVTHDNPAPAFEIKKDCPLTQLALRPLMGNKDMLASNARISMRVEVEFEDRLSTDTQTRSGSFLKRTFEDAVEGPETKISDLELSIDKPVTFNPPWKVSVSSFELGAKPEVLQFRQQNATEFFWKTYNHARTQARDGYDTFVNRLQQLNLPLAFWSKDHIGKSLSQISPEMQSSLNELNAISNTSAKIFDDPVIKNVRLGLAIKFVTRRDAKSEPGQCRFLFYSP